MIWILNELYSTTDERCYGYRPVKMWRAFRERRCPSTTEVYGRLRAYSITLARKERVKHSCGIDSASKISVETVLAVWGSSISSFDDPHCQELPFLNPQASSIYTA
jgi:hypothetical protein